MPNETPSDVRSRLDAALAVKDWLFGFIHAENPSEKDVEDMQQEVLPQIYDLLLALEAAPAEGSNAALVAGNHLPMPLAQFEHRCNVLIEEEQAKPLPDNAVIGVLCDAVRLAREYIAVLAERKTAAPTPAAPCTHERLNEDGQCRSCGGDGRGMFVPAQPTSVCQCCCDCVGCVTGQHESCSYEPGCQLKQPPAQGSVEPPIPSRDLPHGSAEWRLAVVLERDAAQAKVAELEHTLTETRAQLADTSVWHLEHLDNDGVWRPTAVHLERKEDFDLGWNREQYRVREYRRVLDATQQDAVRVIGNALCLRLTDALAEIGESHPSSYPTPFDERPFVIACRENIAAWEAALKETPQGATVTDADVEAVADAVGMQPGGWDTVDPKEIIAAARCLNG